MHTKQENSFIYIMECQQFRKIGITFNIRKRFKNYETHCPIPFSIEGLWLAPTMTAKIVEADARKQLGNMVKNDWQSVQREMAIFVVKEKLAQHQCDTKQVDAASYLESRYAGIKVKTPCGEFHSLYAAEKKTGIPYQTIKERAIKKVPGWELL